jgi:hypothetical protein
MKKLIILFFLSLIGILGYSQIVENGTVYMKHPNIDAVIKSTEAYVAKDINTEKTLYADTAKWWISGLPRPIQMAEAYKMWLNDFTYFDSIQQVKQPGSYPDYIHYKDQDQKTVISWWVWSGNSKKTGEKVTVWYTQFDNFNGEDKIVFESIYGDFSKILKEEEVK